MKQTQKEVQSSPRILLYDTEVSRDVVEGYGKKWEFKVVKTLRHQELMCFAYSWLGDTVKRKVDGVWVEVPKVHYISRHDVSYTDLVQKLRDLLDEAHVVIAHNANGFDNKMANRFFIKEGIAPPSPYKSVDTLAVARREFKFQSNSLKDLATYLDLGAKESITYADLEDDFMSDNPSQRTKRLMERYNKMDVILLEKIYLKFRPFIKNHPNWGDLSQLDGVCPKCGSPNLSPRGFLPTRTGLKRRYCCDDCKGWSSEATLKKIGRKVNVS